MVRAWQGRRDSNTQPVVLVGNATLSFAKKIKPVPNGTGLAGETRFEHATYGFGDRYSTVEPLP